MSLGFIRYWAEVSAAPGTKPKSGAWLMHGVAEVVLPTEAFSAPLISGTKPSRCYWLLLRSL